MWSYWRYQTIKKGQPKSQEYPIKPLTRWLRTDKNGVDKLVFSYSVTSYLSHPTLVSNSIKCRRSSFDSGLSVCCDTLLALTANSRYNFCPSIVGVRINRRLSLANDSANIRPRPRNLPTTALIVALSIELNRPSSFCDACPISQSLARATNWVGVISGISDEKIAICRCDTRRITKPIWLSRM